MLSLKRLFCFFIIFVIGVVFSEKLKDENDSSKNVALNSDTDKDDSLGSMRLQSYSRSYSRSHSKYHKKHKKYHKKYHKKQKKYYKKYHKYGHYGGYYGGPYGYGHVGHHGHGHHGGIRVHLFLFSNFFQFFPFIYKNKILLFYSS